MASVTTTPRTVRFAPKELQEIEEFLQCNRFLDFSNLTRLAISAFIKNPQLKIQAVEKRNVPQAKKRLSKI